MARLAELRAAELEIPELQIRRRKNDE